MVGLGPSMWWAQGLTCGGLKFLWYVVGFMLPGMWWAQIPLLCGGGSRRSKHVFHQHGVSEPTTQHQPLAGDLGVIKKLPVIKLWFTETKDP